MYLRDIWPSVQEVEQVIRGTVRSDMFRASYDAVFDGDERWVSLPVPTGRRYEWDDSSTYVHKPPFFESMPLRRAAAVGHHRGSRAGPAR